MNKKINFQMIYKYTICIRKKTQGNMCSYSVSAGVVCVYIPMHVKLHI